ncbi:tetratricopeptide repeat protein [Sodalis praecaptivus]|uniref:tetratricopeptide repeat protein n=1 Tax=Sodalis praecaptivus TaxID=1239307 RepID=UPI0027EC58ED|nr:tetratricopeptide repeat protein [Sodalis praecaptivus]CAJ0999904.1 Beta-barrel assembly-enhancing protease [Sodalis praecaptivus]
MYNARRLAASGSAAQAVASYRVLFRDAAPPDSLAVEYDDTLAGIPSARPQAIAGLRARLQAQPNDNAARLALGRILTYDEASRREGIATLTPQAADKADYDRYIQRHPGDSALWQHFQQSVGGTEKGAGYAALNSGDIASARSRFEAVLTTNPNDGDALAGLGYIALRNNDFTSAENYLNQATKQGGANSAQWASLAQDAKFYGALNQAKAAAADGNLGQALTLSAPLAQAEGDKGLAAALFRADVQRRQNDLSGAEQTYRTILSRDAQNKDAKLGLYYTLRQENKPRDAQQLLQTLPADERPREVAGNSVDPLRRQAQQALQAGNTPQALARLNEALQKQPTNVWVRLDMARILQQQGDSARAQGLMSAIAQRGAPVDNLYAAALFASETGRMATAALGSRRAAATAPCAIWPTGCAFINSWPMPTIIGPREIVPRRSIHCACWRKRPLRRRPRSAIWRSVCKRWGITPPRSRWYVPTCASRSTAAWAITPRKSAY